MVTISLKQEPQRQPSKVIYEDAHKPHSTQDRSLLTTCLPAHLPAESPHMHGQWHQSAPDLSQGFCVLWGSGFVLLLQAAGTHGCAKTERYERCSLVRMHDPCSITAQAFSLQLAQHVQQQLHGKTHGEPRLSRLAQMV